MPSSSWPRAAGRGARWRAREWRIYGHEPAMFAPARGEASAERAVESDLAAVPALIDQGWRLEDLFGRDVGTACKPRPRQP